MNASVKKIGLQNGKSGASFIIFSENTEGASWFRLDIENIDRM
jgi:hypothetical protein